MDRQSALGLAEKFNKTMRAHSDEMRTARDYGVGFALYHSEVHLLDIIDLHEGENGKELANRLGITKGAVAQTAKKLIEKGLIENFQRPDNKKEVCFRLTESGKKAVRGHKRHHEQMNTGLFEYIEMLGEKDVEIIMRFLDVMEKGVSGG
jgi:DNA-binding MarR family transcriptional regulator